MSQIITGILLFLSVGGLVNIYKQKTNHSYSSHPGLFTLWYAVWVSGCILWLPFPVSVVSIVGVLGAFYLVFLMLWKRLTGGKLNYIETIPTAFKEMGEPRTLSAVPKVFEIFIQDLAAWLIVGALFIFFTHWWIVAIVFSLVVFSLHVPGINMFGPVYGSYFLFMSTIFACIVPFVYPIGYAGFCIVYGLHLLSYMIMYLVFLERH